MNQDEAKGIFLQSLPELSEPLKYAVEFALANWHKLNRRESVKLCDLPHEDWRDVVGYEGLYQVSNYGRVKSFQKNYPKIMKSGVQSKGYVQIRLHKNRHSKNCGVHVLVAQAFIFNPAQKSEVDHRNGDKTNNCIWNLNWATRSENAARAYQLGLIKVNRGTQCHYAKLNAEEVIYIRKKSRHFENKRIIGEIQCES